MIIARQMDVRSNIKKYFDLAYDGETVIIPRKQDKNVVIISETEYNRMQQSMHIGSYAAQAPRAVSFTHTDERPATGHVKSHNLEKLNVIRSLKDGWNGSGAPSFSSSVTDKVEEMINGLNIQPEIFPTALGTIQLEYDNSRRDHMEIEIGKGTVAEIFIVMFNGTEVFEEISATSAFINERVIDFYG